MQSNYLTIAQEVAELVTRKQEAYGDAFGRSEQIFKILFPEGIPVERYTEVLTLVRIIDKIFRIANANDSFNEDAWKDIMGYALLMCEKKGK